MPVTLLKAGQHSCLGRLNGPEGETLADPTRLDKVCMLVYCGSFESMDGPVEITEQHINLLIDNHNGRLERLKRFMGEGVVHIRDNPPLQLDHSTSAQVTVGRVPGRLYKAPYLNPDTGESVPALFCDRVTVLGRENVEKVADGRWAHVSIGADLELGKLNELSITPFPAAGNATLLAKNKLSEGEPMHEKLKKHLMEDKKMSADDAEKLSKEMLGRQMKKLGMDEEKMSAHMAGMDDESMKKLAAEDDEDQKKLAAAEDEKKKELAAKEEEDKAKLAKEEEEEKKKEEAKMTGAQRFIKLAKGLKANSTKLRGDIRMAMVGTTLARLRSAGKLTPAEIKNIDLSKFSTMTENEMDVALSSYEALEPRVQFGAMRGTTKAEALSTVKQKYRMARMELESRMNMPSKRKEAEVAMKRLAEEERQELSEVSHMGADDKSGASAHPKFEELCKMLNEGKHDELKGHLRRMCDHLAVAGETMIEGDDKRMSALAKTHSALQNQFDEFVAAASPVLGFKIEEL